MFSLVKVLSGLLLGVALAIPTAALAAHLDLNKGHCGSPLSLFAL